MALIRKGRIMDYFNKDLKDSLEGMFSQQIKFQKLSGNGDMPRLDGRLVADFSLGLITELGEVLQEYKGWKPWKNSDNYTYNEGKVAEELADMWHHMINISLALGYGSKEIQDVFDKKHKELLGSRFGGLE